MKPLPWIAKWALRQSLGKDRGNRAIDLLESVDSNDLALIRAALEKFNIRL